MNKAKKLKKYAEYLFQEELAQGTIRIYIRQASLLLEYMEGRQITKEEMISYKKHLQKRDRKATTMNLHIVAVNRYLKYAGYSECVLKTQRIQKRRSISGVVTIAEYQKLLYCARANHKEKYYYILRVLAQTGIRISELAFVTVEILAEGKFVVENKGKSREVYLSEKLSTELQQYCVDNGIEKKAVFLNRQHNPIGRTAVNKMFRRLAVLAEVPLDKVHPHSFRHLFALTYMEHYSNLTELADLLGHSSLETTRIYTMATAEEKRIRLSKLPL